MKYPKMIFRKKDFPCLFGMTFITISWLLSNQYTGYQYRKKLQKLEIKLQKLDTEIINAIRAKDCTTKDKVEITTDPYKEE